MYILITLFWNKKKFSGAVYFMTHLQQIFFHSVLFQMQSDVYLVLPLFQDFRHPASLYNKQESTKKIIHMPIIPNN